MAKDEKQLKILMVDDDKFLLDMYSLKFKRSGLAVDVSSSSTAALDKMRADPGYDIVLTDIIMPGMDGLELLKKMREEKLVPNATVIMLTNQADDYEKAKAFSVDSYIIKATTIPSEVVEQVLSVYKNKNPK
jgi:CheY-like chemotaxis protein